MECDPVRAYFQKVRAAMRLKAQRSGRDHLSGWNGWRSCTEGVDQPVVSSLASPGPEGGFAAPAEGSTSRTRSEQSAYNFESKRRRELRCVRISALLRGRPSNLMEQPLAWTCRLRDKLLKDWAHSSTRSMRGGAIRRVTKRGRLHVGRPSAASRVAVEPQSYLGKHGPPGLVTMEPGMGDEGRVANGEEGPG